MKRNEIEALKCATIASLCLFASKKYKNKTAFSMFNEGEINKTITFSQVDYFANLFASNLRQIGVKKGDRVILISDNCPEWPVTYFGIALAGAVSVPLLTGFSIEQIRNIIEHSGVNVICASRSIAEKFMFSSSVPPEIPVIYIDNILDEKNKLEEVSVSKTFGHTQEQNNNSLNPDDLASIIYTSGTQGNSKGVMLSSKNIISSAISSFSFAKISKRDRFLSVLPLAHSYECGLGFIAPVICGASITYLDRPPSPSVLLPALKILRPTAMISVPLLIEKIYKNAIAPKLKKSRLYRNPLTRPLAAWVSGRKLISALGGRIRFFGIGGAPLSAEVEKFLFSAKFPYTIGYGLTEAAPLVAGNAPFRFSLGSGIKAAQSVMMRICKCMSNTKTGEGEIQIHGPNIMMGYYNDKEKTAEVITSDGWLKTGDLGLIDKKGRLHIKGRLKAMILGPSGENIYPEEIEGLLGSSHLVEESLVYSGNKGELIALVRLSEAAKTAAGAVEHALEDLRAWVNLKLSAFSRLNRIEIKYEPFEKTPTMKIKRYLY